MRSYLSHELKISYFVNRPPPVRTPQGGRGLEFHDSIPVWKLIHMKRHVFTVCWIFRNAIHFREKLGGEDFHIQAQWKCSFNHVDS